MTMGERIHDRRKACDLTLEYVGNFVGVAKSTVRKWENGDIENISALRLQKLANVLGTTVDYLMDGITSNLTYKNIEPMPDSRLLPIVGKIACGEPILAKQNIEGYAELDRRVHADFALRCVGEIAAVVIDNEATLKRVYKYPNRIELRPENPLFPVLQYEGAELGNIRIIGKAIAFLGLVR